MSEQNKDLYDLAHKSLDRLLSTDKNSILGAIEAMGPGCFLDDLTNGQLCGFIATAQWAITYGDYKRGSEEKEKEKEILAETSSPLYELPPLSEREVQLIMNSLGATNSVGGGSPTNSLLLKLHHCIDLVCNLDKVAEITTEIVQRYCKKGEGGCFHVAG